MTTQNVRVIVLDNACKTIIHTDEYELTIIPAKGDHISYKKLSGAVNVSSTALVLNVIHMVETNSIEIICQKL